MPKFYTSLLRETGISRLGICTGSALAATLLTGCGVTVGPGLLSPVVWIEQYGAQTLGSSSQTLGFGPEAATSLAADSAGNVVVGGYVAGSFAGFTGDPGVIDAYLTKYGPDGTRLWLQQFPSPQGALLAGVATDASNNIFAVGSSLTSSDSSHAQIFVTKFDPNGKQLWSISLPAYTGTTFGGQVKTEADGSIVVAGFGFFSGSAQETLFAARLSGVDGHILWVNPYTLPVAGLINGMALDGSGNPMIVATVNAADSTSSPYAAKLNQGDGSILWTHQIASTPNSMIPFCITVDASGNPIVGGSTFTGALNYGFSALAGEQGVLYKLNGTDGSQQWMKTYSTGKGDSITGVETSKDGTIYATGYTNGHFNQYETATTNTIFFLAIESDGTLNSAHQFGAGPLINATVPFGPLTTMDDSGNIFVSGATTGAYPGFTNSSNALQMFIAKLTPAPLIKN